MRRVPSLLPRTLWFAGMTSGFSRELYFRHREYNSLLGAAAIVAVLIAKILLVPRVKVTTSIARTSIVLALLSLAALAANSAAGNPQLQPAHTPTPPQTEAKISSGSHVQPLRPGYQFPYRAKLELRRRVAFLYRRNGDSSSRAGGRTEPRHGCGRFQRCCRPALQSAGPFRIIL